MGASRTLLRKGRAEEHRRSERGKRVKPGNARRRCWDVSDRVLGHFNNGASITYETIGKEADFHATKGLRVRRAR